MEYDILHSNKKSIAISNNKLLDELDQFTPLVSNYSTIGVTKAQAREIYEAVYNNPVASIWSTSKYDPDDLGIGFCFGRAMAVHIEALHRRVNPSSIKKVFAVGNLVAGNTNWGFHVTTIIRAQDGGWYAIDPIMGKPITVRDWYKTMRTEYDPNKTMKMYVTSANRFSPDESTHYLPQNLFLSAYHGYFEDLMSFFRQRSGTPHYKPISISNLPNFFKSTQTKANTVEILTGLFLVGAITLKSEETLANTVLIITSEEGEYLINQDDLQKMQTGGQLSEMAIQSVNAIGQELLISPQEAMKKIMIKTSSN
ncbi:MAG: hypothetical protein A2504_13850 [Bdellovibrionales bacterium RIFOXYD12_FULL_39_22]|nr:MAG: hypothetical protein A2385_00575 [Bdellovibrionales bacterium RIFOXYB1_FULL_39_21]OFZ43828.1 MAG: hypothetical protein A2485_04955 [Bdellovibrionales bacterium RIFOXYC12_FULL_39_17]OFZ48838.1 MAG: hypothetical protein A2404_17890 [Bdellovibrionales bacterium RIFOXYC1_FULL_39_130]OFZ76571.1 MAG: hypothetical protein A2560_06555 [Bdellovibrionales bacterium RIFOXYD1_FULL_39_84]OFZ94805.1 MAG: hypothetical protein A2504_13850 [Bdellovibrionales bacterium RIFOXYD12_FULL_39_22]HLE12229.1 pr